MKKNKHSFVLTIILFAFLFAGCNPNQTEQKKNDSNHNSSKETAYNKDSNKVSAMNESNTDEEPDIIIDYTCSILEEEVAAKIGNEIKEIITSAQEGVYQLSNFTIAFSNQTKKGSDLLIDIMKKLKSRDKKAGNLPARVSSLCFFLYSSFPGRRMGICLVLFSFSFLGRVSFRTPFSRLALIFSWLMFWILNCLSNSPQRRSL